MMKKIIIDGVEYMYDSWVDDFKDRYTDFYQGFEPHEFREFVFFGKKKTAMLPKKIFRLWMDIESPKFSKIEVLEAIRKKISLIDREAEIKRGEIV